MVHPILELPWLLSPFPLSICYFRDSTGSDWRSFSAFKMDFGTLSISLREFGTSDFQAIGTLFTWSICSFRNHREVIGGCSLPWNGFWNPRYILKKIWYILKKFWYIQSSGYRTPISLSIIDFFIKGCLKSDWRSFPTLE